MLCLLSRIQEQVAPVIVDRESILASKDKGWSSCFVLSILVLGFLPGEMDMDILTDWLGETEEMSGGR